MSRKTSTLLHSIAAAALWSEAALAACDVDFDNAPARGLTASMVRAFQACPGTPYPAFGNNQTEGGVTACSPVLPRYRNGDETTYHYAADGRCEVRISSKLASDCAKVDGSDGSSLGLPAGPCHVSKISAKCQGVRRYDEMPIDAGDSSWTLFTILRASIDDDANGPMTVIDLPVLFEFDTPKDGAMKLSAISAEQLQDLGVFLPACTALQVVDMEIRDPSGLPFAGMGGATIPANP